MKARAFLGFLACFPIVLATPLPADDKPPLAVPHPELAKIPDTPIGLLGLRLGTFAVIEGTEHPTSMLLGSDDFYIESINGKKLEHEVRIMTEWSPQLPDKRVAGKHYVLHGYERGKWQGQPVGLPGGEPSGITQGGDFIFEHIFAVTSVEKVDGVVSANARPLNPKVPLAEPKLEAVTKVGKPPIGALGLPLGTFAIIEAHTPAQSPMIGSPFEVDVVNGQHLDKPVIITIRGVPETKGDERVTLRGYETGQWICAPFLPKSEELEGREQASFHFSGEFVLTTPCKGGDTPAQ